MAAKTSSTRLASTPTISELMTPVHLKRSANLRASIYAPNAAPIANATPGSPTGSVTLTCEASMPRLLSEKPWELVLRFSEPPTPSVITVKRIWKKFGPEPDTPLLPRKEAVSEKPGMLASPLLAAALPMKKTIDASSANTTLAPRPMPRLAPMVFMDCGVVSAVMVGSAAGRAICWVGWLGCGAAAGCGAGDGAYWNCCVGAACGATGCVACA